MKIPQRLEDQTWRLIKMYLLHTAYDTLSIDYCYTPAYVSRDIF